MLPTDKKEICPNDDALNNLHIDRNFITSTRENVAASINTEQQSKVSMSGNKLHRKDPLTIRQQIQPFDNLVPETSLADVQLSEMPGLQNTEQWKRIAARTGQTSPPLSRQYYQKAAPKLELQPDQMSEVLGSYRRPGRLESAPDTATVGSSQSKRKRRKIIIGLSIAAIIVAIVVSIVVAVILVRRPIDGTTDYYAGHIIVQARFDPVLLSSSSTLAKNYQREFCSLVSTTLSDRKTKYAIFYSTCTVYNFRNGSIIGDFILGFTRYQNVTRLNAFLDRTIVDQQLFGGTILSIIFNLTANEYVNTTNETDYIDYDENNSNKLVIDEQIVVTTSTNKQNQDAVTGRSNEQQLVITYVTTEKAQSTSDDLTSVYTLPNVSPSSLITDQYKRLVKRQKPIQDYLLQEKVISSEGHYYSDQPLYNKNSRVPLPTVLSRFSSLDIPTETNNNFPTLNSIKTRTKFSRTFHNNPGSYSKHSLLQEDNLFNTTYSVQRTISSDQPSLGTKT